MQIQYVTLDPKYYTESVWYTLYPGQSPLRDGTETIVGCSFAIVDSEDLKTDLASTMIALTSYSADEIYISALINASVGERGHTYYLIGAATTSATEPSPRYVVVGKFKIDSGGISDVV